MAFDDEFVEVGRLDRVHGLQSEVVEDEQVDAGELAHLGLAAVVEPGSFETPEKLVGTAEQHGFASADRDVAEGGREDASMPVKAGSEASFRAACDFCGWAGKVLAQSRLGLAGQAP